MQRVKSYTVDEVSQAIAESQGLLLVHFGSPLASSCEFVRRELELLASRSTSQVPLTFAEVELPLQELGLIQQYGIEEIPTLILFRDGAEVERLERVLLPEELEEFLEASVSFYAGGNDA